MNRASDVFKDYGIIARQQAKGVGYRVKSVRVSVIAAAVALGGTALPCGGFQVTKGPHGDLYVPADAGRLTPKVLAVGGDVGRTLAARGAIVSVVKGGDVCRAAEHLSAWRTNDFTETIFIVGESSGAGVALTEGARLGRRKVAGVVSVSGRGFPASVSADMPDVLLVHQMFDEIAPVRQVKDFESRLRDAGSYVETDYCDAVRTNADERVWRFIAERFGKDALEVVGTVRAKSSREISGVSTVSVGFEGLDRHLFDPGPCYDRLAETGVKRARIQSGWCLCEPSRGVYDFTELDAVVSNLCVRGIEPWMMVGFGNTNWMGRCYTPAAVGCMPLYYGPECQAAWERFVAKLARRYGDRVRRWEVWNEPDIDCFWQPRTPSAADYARLVELTAGIIRREAPGAKVGGVCSTVFNDWTCAAVPLVAKDVDFWSVHAYGIVPEMARGEQRDPKGRTWDFAGQIAAVRALFAAAGRPDVEIWQGEAGFPSWFKADHWLMDGNREGYGCEEWQAKWLLRRYLTDRRAGCASTSFYACADICRSYSMATTTQAHPAEHGLLDSRRGYARKASHRAMSVYNATLAEARFVSSARIGSVIVDTYARGGEELIAYYRPDDLRLGNRAPRAWKEGDRVVPRDGVIVDLLSGRVYRRPDVLPLSDHPYLWHREAGKEMGK